MTMAELATIVQENLKVNIAIINNGYLGMVRQWQEFFYDRNYEATPLAQPGLHQTGRGLRHQEHHLQASATTWCRRFAPLARTMGRC